MNPGAGGVDSPTAPELKVRAGVLPIVRCIDYFRAYALRALCKARSMPHGRMKHLQLMAGESMICSKKEAAYSPPRSTSRTSGQRRSLSDLWEGGADVVATVQGRFDPLRRRNPRRTGSSLSAVPRRSRRSKSPAKYAQRTALPAANPTGPKPMGEPPIADGARCTYACSSPKTGLRRYPGSAMP